MKTLAALFFILFFTGYCKGQTNEFAPIGAKWWYGYQDFFTVGYFTIESIGDTLIEGKTCRILLKH